MMMMTILVAIMMIVLYNCDFIECKCKVEVDDYSSAQLCKQALSRHDFCLL